MKDGSLKFKVWAPGRGDFEDEAKVIEAWDASAAAEAYAERSYHDDQFREEVEVHVRAEPADGAAPARFMVGVSFDPTFTAYEMDEEDTE